MARLARFLNCTLPLQHASPTARFLDCTLPLLHASLTARFPYCTLPLLHDPLTARSPYCILPGPLTAHSPFRTLPLLHTSLTARSPYSPGPLLHTSLSFLTARFPYCTLPQVTALPLLRLTAYFLYRTQLGAWADTARWVRIDAPATRRGAVAHQSRGWCLWVDAWINDWQTFQ
jgi:hypothetical protein